MDNDQLRQCVKFQIRRNITNLFKNFLTTLEDIKVNEEEYKKYRNRILDNGNNCLREVEELLDSLQIDFRKQNENKKES